MLARINDNLKLEIVRQRRGMDPCRGVTSLDTGSLKIYLIIELFPFSLKIYPIMGFVFPSPVAFSPEKSETVSDAQNCPRRVRFF